MANNGIFYSSGNTLNFTTNNTTWATLTSGGTFIINTVSGGTYLNLPPSTGSTSGAYLPLSGGTVTGATNFTGGLSANTFSSTTYQNLPVSAVTSGTGISASTSNGTVTITNTSPDKTVTISGGTGITTGGTYPNFTLVNSLPDQTVTITGGTNIQISGAYPNFGVNYTGQTSFPYLPLSGGTVSGGTNFTGGLTANTISATTYYNLPVTADTYVTGFTLNSNTITLSQNRNDSYSSFTISLSAYTGSSISGTYLPLSGGTMTGGLVANSGVTASTISQTTYIDFTTGSTNPSSVSGRVFFDSTQKALSYFDISNNQVPIAMGQQLYTRVYNATGVQIDKGKVISVTGTTNSLPSITLATNNHVVTSARPVGLSAENIPNGSEGLVLVAGILSGITLNTFANGDTLYLSDTVPGGYVATTSSLSYTARTNEIGYVLQTGSTTGKIYVNINNEDSNLSLTDIERNILEGNVISSGIYTYTGMTQGTGQTINVALARGWIARNTYDYATLPDVTNINYTGGTNIPLTYLNSADATYILLTSASTLFQQTTFPTPQERRQNILLGKVVHPNRSTITSINQTVDFDVSPMAAIRDLWTPLKLINQGVVVSANGVNMNINSSAGTLWGNGIGWTTNQQNPDSISMSGQSPVTFQYRTQLGPLTGGSVTTGNTTTINPAYYDNNGVVTAVGGGANSSTNQRIYMFPTGLIRIQLGQQVYGNLAAAIAGAQTEQFVEYSNNRDNGILIGILSVNKNASVGNGGLVNTSYATFNFVSKFGEVLGGTGGISTTTLQQAYDNSSNPEILTNSSLGGLSIKNGTGNADNVTNLLEGQNTAGTVTSFIRADGAFSGTSIYGTGLTATTISATTYQNLPTDIRTTGGTYSNNTFTFTNNTGGTYSVLFNTVTGLTINGNLTVTGNTSLQALTATTISASTLATSFTTGSVIFQGSGGTLSQSNSNLFWDNVNNRLGILTSVPAYGLDVNGTSRLNGLSSINGTGVTNTALSIYANGTGAGNYIFQGFDSSSVQRSYLTSTGNFRLNAATDTGTSGTDEKIRALYNFSPTSGKREHYGFYMTQTINQTGGSSGITRAIYIVPTLTSAYDYRTIEWTNTTGYGLYGSGSAPNYLQGNTLIGTTANTGTYKLDVRGATRLSATTGTSLTVISSGNSTSVPVFSVQGSQGELFSVTDSLTGSLFSVSDISGLPILEVFSDSTTIIGDYQAPSLYTTKRVSSITASTGTTIYSFPTSAYTSSFVDYYVSGSTGLRAGNIMAIWSGSTVNFTETSTNDIGVTTPVTFGYQMSGSSAVLRASASTGTWIVESILRGL